MTSFQRVFGVNDTPFGGLSILGYVTAVLISIYFGVVDRKYSAYFVTDEVCLLFHILGFWLIFVFVICLISSCIGCCVRASRRRRMAQYARINATRTSGYGTTTHVTVTTPNYPVGVAQPPPYNAGKVEYPAGTHHAPPQYSQ